MPSTLCTAVGEVIREMSVEDVSCHCGCQDRTHRFDIHYRFDQTALVRDVACRRGLLHAMMHHFEVSYRNVTYVAGVKDVAFMEESPDLTARTWEEVGQVAHLATLRHFATFGARPVAPPRQRFWRLALRLRSFGAANDSLRARPRCAAKRSSHCG